MKTMNSEPSLVQDRAGENSEAADSDGPLDAAVGIKNGLKLGGAFWIGTYLTVSLVGAFA